jgi:hypothetical protein
MTAFEFVQAMRDALDEAMTKAYLAEYILKAAAQGHTTYQERCAE